MSGKQKDLDNRSNQSNPNNDAYHTSTEQLSLFGYTSELLSSELLSIELDSPSELMFDTSDSRLVFDWSSNLKSGYTPTKSDNDNHGNQLNPNNPEYTHSRVAGSKK